MLYGMIFTTILDWFSFALGFSIFFLIFTKKQKDPLNKSFAVLWLFLALISLFGAAAVMFGRRGMYDITESLYYGKLIVSYLAFIPGSIFIIYKVFKNKKYGYAVSLLYLIVFPIYLYFLFSERLILQETNYFSLIYKLNQYTLLVHLISILPLLPFGLYDLIKSLYLYSRKRTQPSLINLLYILSLVLAGVYFIPQDTGILSGWSIAFFKILFVVAVLVGFYSVYYNKDE